MKKASIFVVGVIIVAFLVLVSAFGFMFYKYSKTGVLGNEQFSLMKAYLEGEKTLLYMDTASEYAYEQAAYWFAFNAGFYGESDCNINGFNIINGDCNFNDDIIKENFDTYLNHFFNQYSKNYENSYIPFNIYEFYEKGDEIIGFAKYPVVVLIGKSQENVNCFPGALKEFPVAGDIEDTWGSEESPDSIKINVRNPNTGVIAVIDGKIKDLGTQNGGEFIEISSEIHAYTFHYSHLKVSSDMIKDGYVRAGDVIGSASDFIKLKVYRENIPMNPICALQRIRKSNEVKGYYYVKPHISFKPKYNFFEDFNKVMDMAQEMIDDCGDDISCIKNNYNNKKINTDLILHVGDCEGNEIMSNDVLGFCVGSEDEKKSFYVYDKTTNKISLEPIKFRFALGLSKGFTPPEIPLPEAPPRPPGPAAPAPGTSQKIDNYLQSKGAPWAGQGQCMIDASESTGVPVILMMALPVQEGGWSGSQLQRGYCPSSCIGASSEYTNPQNKKAYNLFSIKGDGCWWRTWEVVGGEIIHTCASFRAYTNYCDSINDFARLVSTSDRYSEAMKHTDDPEEFIRQMLKAGWATDPKWADKVINIMRTINNEMG